MIKNSMTQLEVHRRSFWLFCGCKGRRSFRQQAATQVFGMSCIHFAVDLSKDSVLQEQSCLEPGRSQTIRGIDVSLVLS